MTKYYEGNPVIVSTGTTQVTGNICAIQVLEDATFSEFTEVNATGSMVGITVPAGVTLYGDINSYTLTSGKVRAYKS